MLDRIIGRAIIAVVGVSALGVIPIRAENPARVTPSQMDSIIARIRPNQAMGWAKIPWAGSLSDARQVSRRENVPLFLFVLDGNLAAGRC